MISEKSSRDCEATKSRVWKSIGTRYKYRTVMLYAVLLTTIFLTITLPGFPADFAASILHEISEAVGHSDKEWRRTFPRGRRGS